jgi:hypothetical protein
MSKLKPNYVGIVGGILAFISLVLPWWAISVSSSAMGQTFSGGASVYPYQATATAMGVSETVSMNLWFGWIALVLVVIGGLLGLIGSVVTAGRRMLLAVGGLLLLLSIMVFAVGLQNEISNENLATGFPTGAALFSSSSYNYGAVSMNYSTYLSFGFWLALVAAIIMFAASVRKPVEAIPQPSPPSPTA